VQVTAARHFYDGPVDDRGRYLYPGGEPYGSELSWAGRGAISEAGVTMAAQNVRLMFYPWVGTADPAAGVYSVPDYYQRVQNAAGGMEETRRFARLFQIPGAAHCGGGYMPFEEDILGALVKWTEVGTAPDEIIATAALQDGSVRTRPVYAYPVRAVYVGKGDINDARNFSGAMPKRAPNDLFDWLGSQTARVEQ
jgi:hypothetical protein